MKSTTFALQVTNENNLPNFNLTTLPLSTNSVGFNTSALTTSDIQPFDTSISTTSSEVVQINFSRYDDLNVFSKCILIFFLICIKLH